MAAPITSAVPSSSSRSHAFTTGASGSGGSVSRESGFGCGSPTNSVTGGTSAPLSATVPPSAATVGTGRIWSASVVVDFEVTSSERNQPHPAAATTSRQTPSVDTPLRRITPTRPRYPRWAPHRGRLPGTIVKISSGRRRARQGTRPASSPSPSHRALPTRPRGHGRAPAFPRRSGRGARRSGRPRRRVRSTRRCSSSALPPSKRSLTTNSTVSRGRSMICWQ